MDLDSPTELAAALKRLNFGDATRAKRLSMRLLGELLPPGGKSDTSSSTGDGANHCDALNLSRQLPREARYIRCSVRSDHHRVDFSHRTQICWKM